jgi:hypothetical protein
MKFRTYLDHVYKQTSSVEETILTGKFIGIFTSFGIAEGEDKEPDEPDCFCLYDDNYTISRFPLDQEIEFDDNDVIVEDINGIKSKLTFFASFVISKPDVMEGEK